MSSSSRTVAALALAPLLPSAASGQTPSRYVAVTRHPDGRMKQSFVLAIALLSINETTSIAAQAVATGTAVVRMKVHLPATAAAAAGGQDMENQMTFWSDGHRVAMEMITGGLGPAGGMVIRTIFTLAGDSVHIGIMSPKLAAATGSAGIRMDAALGALESSVPVFGGLIDSLSKVISSATFRSLGTTSVVAGITCAEWEMVTGVDTARTCVVPTPSELVPLQQAMAKLPAIGNLVTSMSAAIQQKAFNGVSMIALRTTSAKSSMELISFAAGIPSATEFELPANLTVMPAP